MQKNKGVIIIISIIKRKAENNPFQPIQCNNCQKIGFNFDYGIIVFEENSLIIPKRIVLCEDCMNQIIKSFNDYKGV